MISRSIVVSTIINIDKRPPVIICAFDELTISLPVESGDALLAISKAMFSGESQSIESVITMLNGVPNERLSWIVLILGSLFRVTCGVIVSISNF
jgi:hypothetical protein